MQRIAHGIYIFLSAASNGDVAVGKDRRLQFSVGTRERNVVQLFGRIEVPDARTYHIVCQSKHRARDILGRVSTTCVDCKSLDGGDRPDKKVEQVEAMRAQIQKQARAGDCRIKTPCERSFACRKRSV